MSSNVKEGGGGEDQQTQFLRTDCDVLQCRGGRGGVVTSKRKKRRKGEKKEGEK